MDTSELSGVVAVEFRLRPTTIKPTAEQNPADMVDIDRSLYYETYFPTRNLDVPGKYYLHVSVWNDNGRFVRKENYGWGIIYVDPVPTVHRVRPLIVSGTPKVVGLNLYNVPEEGVKVIALGRGFAEGKRRVPLRLVGTDGEMRTYRIPNSLTIGGSGLARLEVAVVPLGKPKRNGVRVRARSIETILRRNRNGDTTVHQAPNGYRCWVGYPRLRVSCLTTSAVMQS